MATRKQQSVSQPVQAFVRVRPFTGFEGGSAITSITSKEILIKDHTKRYTFDRIFNEESTQQLVYKTVVGKLLEDVIKGYNCTVFAYGQTGTGKTFTMIGNEPENNNYDWDQETEVGCIMRTAMQLYQELTKIENVTQHTVSVSFMEIYNEEIRDLLSDRELTPLRVYEDMSKITRVTDLSEITVLGPGDIFRLLHQGCEKRQTASTQMNIHSSRSHTVFTINVSTLQSKLENPESITCGKLNLVDLAGSENIGKSGAKNMRAREAGSINQSLLTLGRVMKSLAESASHIPYSESKLTRILQDSLGGRTKTCIIATISPGVHSLEETLSTLDYAHCARNITNCPQISIKSGTLEADLNEKVLRLKKDLFATVNESGCIYLNKGNYDDMVKSLDYSKKNLADKHKRIESLNEQLELANEQLQEWDALNVSFKKTQDAAEKYRHKSEQERKVADYYQKQGTNLLQTAVNLRNYADQLVRHEDILHIKLQKERTTSTNNVQAMGNIIRNIDEKLNDCGHVLNENCEHVINLLQGIKSDREQVNKMHERVQSKIIEESNKLTEESKLELNQCVDNPYLERLNKLLDDIKIRNSKFDEHFDLNSKNVHACEQYLLNILEERLNTCDNVVELNVINLAASSLLTKFKEQKAIEEKSQRLLNDDGECFENIILVCKLDSDKLEREIEIRKEMESYLEKLTKENAESLKIMDELNDKRKTLIQISQERSEKINNFGEEIREKSDNWDSMKNNLASFKYYVSNMCHERVQSLTRVKTNLTNGLEKLFSSNSVFYDNSKNNLNSIDEVTSSFSTDICKLRQEECLKTANEKMKMVGVLKHINDFDKFDLNERCVEIEGCIRNSKNIFKDETANILSSISETFNI